MWRKITNLFKWLAGLALVLFCVLIITGVYLDRKLVERFSGEKWQVPAKVFARPLELYAGALVTQKAFLEELKRLRYVQSANIHEPGHFRVNTGQVSLFTRGFRFWDGFEEKRKLTVSFSGDVISHLTDDRNQPIGIARLEPVLIGGIYPDHNEDRILLKLDQTPLPLIQTLLVVEDRDFFKHHGLSLRGITRAFIANLKSGAVRQGGSTLTQQLVKNFFLENERTLSRKLTEAYMAILLEARFSKEEILEAYLNEVYLGQAGGRAIHGFGLGSHHYFGKPLEELDLAQTALLVSLVKGPSYYDPIRHPERALARRNQVLDLLAQRNLVFADDIAKAQKKPLSVLKTSNSAVNRYPAFLDLVKRQLQNDYPEEALESEGLRIFTTLDPRVQNALESQTLATLKHLNQDSQLQAAAIVTEPQTGEVLALIGSATPRNAGFNRALDAYRAVGSVIKPVVYLTALAQPKRYGLQTFISDDPISVTTVTGAVWQPKNFDHESHGQVMLQEALANSYNQATTRLGMELGLKNIVRTLQRLGLEREVPEVPSLLLGSIELTPFEVASLYQTIAANGFKSPIRSIRAVETGAGEPLTRYPLKVRQAFDANSIFLLKHALEQTVRTGTAKAVYQSFPQSFAFAGKTGTTDDLRDSWFAGMSENYLTVVWLGHDDNSATHITGASGALKLWINFMKSASPESLRNPTPEGFRRLWLDAYTGELSLEDCPDSVWVALPTEQAPTRKTYCSRSLAKQPTRFFKRWFKQ